MQWHHVNEKNAFSTYIESNNPYKRGAKRWVIVANVVDDIDVIEGAETQRNIFWKTDNPNLTC